MNLYGYINRGLFSISPAQMYDNILLENFEEERGFDSYNIYLICQRPKFYFVEKLCKIHNKEFLFTVCNGEIQVSGSHSILPENNKRKVNNPVIDQNISSTNQIVINNNNENVIIDIEEIEAGIKQKHEIVYIGKSKRVDKRLKLHQTYLQILAEKKENKNIVIQLMSFGSGIGNFNKEAVKRNEKISKMTFSREGQKEYEENYSIFESILINYYRPKYNDQYTVIDLSKNDKIQTKLISNGIKKVMVATLAHPENTEIWSINQQLKCSSFCYDLIKNTYSEAPDLNL